MKKHEEFLKIFNEQCTGIDRCIAYERAEEIFTKKYGHRKYKNWLSCRNAQAYKRKKVKHRVI